MKNFALLLTAFLFLLFSCSKRCVEDAIQSGARCEAPWLTERIAKAQRGSVVLDSVVEFQYKDSYAYMFCYSAVADASSPVYNCKGDELCNIGGISGNMKCEGVRFDSLARNPNTIWRK